MSRNCSLQKCREEKKKKRENSKEKENSEAPKNANSKPKLKGDIPKTKRKGNKPRDMKEGDGKEQEEVKTAAKSANATLEKQKSPFTTQNDAGEEIIALPELRKEASSFVAPLNPDKQNTLPQENPLQVTKRGNLKKHAYDESKLPRRQLSHYRKLFGLMLKKRLRRLNQPSPIPKR